MVKEPFYIRQMTVPVAHKVMREMGVRFNDFGTFGRANRFVRKDAAERRRFVPLRFDRCNRKLKTAKALVINLTQRDATL